MGDYTCHKYNGKSVIDYAVASRSLFPLIAEFYVDLYDKCLSDSHSPICITIRIKDQFKLSSPETKDNTIKGKSSNINTIKYKCKWEKECESDYVNAFDYDRVNSINEILLIILSQRAPSHNQ